MNEIVYCTWKHRVGLPNELKYKFRDLDQFIRELSSSATKSIIIVAPYLSSAGLEGLRGSLAASVINGAWIRLVTDDISSTSRNKQAIETLVSGKEGEIIKKRLRILTKTTQLPVLFHAKLLLVDSVKGYMGSANLSWRGMEENFEVGTALSAPQVESLEMLIKYFESVNFIADLTDSIL